MTLARHAVIVVPRMPPGLRWLRSGRHARPRDPLVMNSVYLMAATIVTSLLGYVFWTVAARLYSASAIGEAGAGMTAQNPTAVFVLCHTVFCVARAVLRGSGPR